MRTLGIIGCGWIGTRIGDFLKEEYKIVVTTRSKVAELQSKDFEVIQADFTLETPFSEIINSADVLILSANFPKINVDFWLKNLITFIGEFNKPIYLCSSTGIYSDQEGVIDEVSQNLNPEILNIENQLKSAYPQLNVLRLGGLMGDERYLSKWFMNKPLPKPGAKINYVHFEDIRHIVKRMVDLGISGKTYNVVAPIHPLKCEVYKAQTGISVPFDTEYNRVISSKNLIKEIGYTFVYPNPLEFPYNKK